MKTHVRMFAHGFPIMLCGLLFSLLAHADEEEPESPWSGLARFGYLATSGSGNTDTDSINGWLSVKYQPGSWNYDAFAGGNISLQWPWRLKVLPENSNFQAASKAIELFVGLRVHLWRPLGNTHSSR